MSKVCTVPPAGWSCSREPGHPGPCAASPKQIDPSTDYAGILSECENPNHWKNPETGYVECDDCCGRALDLADERLRFERWYADNRQQLYMKYVTELRMAVEDTARAAWFAGQEK